MTRVFAPLRDVVSAAASLCLAGTVRPANAAPRTVVSNANGGEERLETCINLSLVGAR